VLHRNIQFWPCGIEARDRHSPSEEFSAPVFHHLKSSGNSHQRARQGRDVWTSTLSEIESQNDQANGISLERQRKMIGQRSDKPKCKSLKQELLNCEGKVLQNLDTPVRSWAAPPSSLRRSVCENAAFLRQRSAKPFASKHRGEQGFTNWQ
jgi:hypothetical protein